MSLTRTNQKGFTIVELLIVIVVIAILAAISIVAYTGIQDRSRNSSAANLASQVAKKAEIYYALNSTYPTTAANFTGEAALESLKVTLGTTGQPASPHAAATFNSVADMDTQYVNGQRVVYVGGANGYTIHYRTAAATSATISKGTPPSGVYAFGSNQNP